MSIKISIHALREEGDPLYPACGSRSSKISIHALREEGDTYRWSALKKPRYFYPRPPRGGRHILQSYPQKTALFLSTPSARRATRIENKPVWRSHNFYPRPPRGGRPQKHVQMGVKRVISIHALREEGDDEPEGLTNKKTISIHALREEGDLVHLFRAVSGFDFYPRPPRGGRPVAGHQPPHPPPFLSTPSARRATSNLFYSVYVELDFYPRPPRGGRRAALLRTWQATCISIHALREEGDTPPFFPYFV